MHNNYEVVDDNVLHSLNDSIERLWIKVNINNVNITLAAVYMPNDGRDRDISNELVNTLLDETAKLEAEGQRVIILGDFNGRLNQFRKPGSQSYNGDLLYTFIECSSYNVVNCMPKCTGVTTWRRGTQNSTIDYVLTNDRVSDSVLSMVIDEECKYSLGSDQHMIVLTMDKHLKWKEKGKSKLA